MIPEAELFCTVVDVERFLQVTIAEDKLGSLARAISEATEAIRNYCRQRILLVEDDEITLDVGDAVTRLYLGELPVVSVASVVEDGDTLTAGSDEDYQLGQYGVLHRVSQYWAPGIQIVVVTYTHGYAQDELPQDIIDVCTRAASRAYQAGLRASEVAGVSGVQAMSLGDYAVTFGAEGGGGISEGVLGASAARMLLLSEKDMLDTYRV